VTVWVAGLRHDTRPVRASRPVAVAIACLTFAMTANGCHGGPVGSVPLEAICEVAVGRVATVIVLDLFVNSTRRVLVGHYSVDVDYAVMDDATPARLDIYVATTAGDAIIGPGRVLVDSESHSRGDPILDIVAEGSNGTVRVVCAYL